MVSWEATFKEVRSFYGFVRIVILMKYQVDTLR